MSHDLAGRVVAVTGASSGIGKGDVCDSCEIQIASARRRTLAALIDVGLTSALGLGAIAGGFAAGALRERLGGEDAGGPDAKTSRLTPSLRLEAMLAGVTATFAVASRNSRGPGFRVCELRRVDARTGGSVGMRSAAIGVLLRQIQQGVTRAFIRPSTQAQDRLRALRPRLKEIERRYASDPEGRNEALMELYRENGVDPLTGCRRSVIGPVLTGLIVDLVPLRGRTLRDRLTGTAVIVNR